MTTSGAAASPSLGQVSPGKDQIAGPGIKIVVFSLLKGELVQIGFHFGDGFYPKSCILARGAILSCSALLFRRRLR